MRISVIKRFCFIVPALYLSLTFFSCNTTREVKYFQDIPDSGQTKQISRAEYTPLVIEPGDILNISIQTIDQLTTSSINDRNSVSASPSIGGGGGSMSNILSAATSGTQQSSISGYTVDKDGYVEISIIGKIKAAGFTTADLKDSIYKVAVKYYKDPLVTVKLANFKVNMIGEVLRPGQYIMPDEKESILDAIAMAGDLTIFGKRENVLLVRQNQDGTKTAYRINLKKTNSLTASTFYLRPNDVIYVEPRKAKSDANDASQAKYFSFGAAVLSLLIILATRVK